MPQEREKLTAQDVKGRFEEDAKRLLETGVGTNEALYKGTETFILLARLLLNGLLDQRRFFGPSDPNFMNYSLLMQELPKAADLVRDQVDIELLGEIMGKIDRRLKAVKEKLLASVMAQSRTATAKTQPSPTVRSAQEEGVSPDEDEYTVASKRPGSGETQNPTITSRPMSPLEAILRVRERRY